MMEEHSVSSMIKAVSARFEAAGLDFGHGTDNAWDEAAWLVLHCAELPLDSETIPDIALTAEQLALIEGAAQVRIEQRQPMAYVLRSAWFAGMPFYVDERVLVPRSPIAELIEDGYFSFFQKEPSRILDLCTGSGCIGIASAVYCPEAQVVLADLSPEALEVARINTEAYDLSERVSTVQSDLLSNVTGRFDLIVTNPPYVDAQAMRELTPEYEAEPALGLAAGTDGLDLAHQILAQSAAFLNEEGWLIMEVGASDAALAQAYAPYDFEWLHFARGGGGILAITQRDLALLQRRG